MASFGRSLKTAYFPTAGLRPAMPRRTLSSSSEASSSSSGSASSPYEESQFALSACNTPSSGHPPASACPGISTARPSGFVVEDAAAPTDQQPASAPAKAQAEPSQALGPPNPGRPNSGRPNPGYSRPIAIDLPGVRKLSTAPTYTPPAPLSGRGDIPGGYFPFHEDPTSRVHRPHPFQHGTKRDQQQLARSTDEPEKLRQQVRRAPPDDAAMPAAAASSHLPLLEAAHAAADSQVDASITSYIPTGLQDSPLPMGKYYPSNYERRAVASSEHLRPAGSILKSHAAVSESRAPKHGLEPSRPNQASDTKRRLQQYQRDMIAQARLAAREILGSSTRPGGSTRAPTAPAVEGISLKGIQFGGSILRGYKPLSPRLLPLGSPGPVTPMELEERNGYLAGGEHAVCAEERQEHEQVRPASCTAEERLACGGSTIIDA